ncbi:MAG: Gp49 family protein [Porticoccaceae bacterium]
MTQVADGRIASITYHRLVDTLSTICVLRLVNGFVVIGQSHCLNPAQYSQEEGKSLAYAQAYEKVCELEAYLDKEAKYQSELAVAPACDIKKNLTRSKK